MNDYRARDIFEEARDKWPSILPMFGVSPKFLTGRHSPCPMCGGKDRFRFTNFRDRGNWICSHCGHGDGMGLIMAMSGMDWMGALTEVRDKLGSAEVSKPRPRMSSEKARSLCVELWKESVPIREGDDAERYLASRGFSPPFGQQLRFHPKVPVKDHPDKAYLPAMLARVSDNSGMGVNIHRTYLVEGRKAEWEIDGIKQSAKKLMPGAIPVDAAIRLFPHEGELGVAEGIETALAVYRDYRIPCWAMISSGQMKKWVPPKGVKVLHVFGDADHKFGGQAAAYTLAHRVACQTNPPQVFVRVPDKLGVDWAD